MVIAPAFVSCRSRGTTDAGVNTVRHQQEVARYLKTRQESPELGLCLLAPPLHTLDPEEETKKARDRESQLMQRLRRSYPSGHRL